MQTFTASEIYTLPKFPAKPGPHDAMTPQDWERWEAAYETEIIRHRQTVTDDKARLHDAILRHLQNGGTVIEGDAADDLARLYTWKAHDGSTAAGTFLPEYQTPEYLAAHIANRVYSWFAAYTLA